MYEHLKRKLEELDKSELSEYIIGLSIGGYNLVEKYQSLISIMDSILEDDFFMEPELNKKLTRNKEDAENVMRLFLDYSSDLLKKINQEDVFISEK